MKKVRLFAVAAAMGMFASTVAAAEPVVSTGYTTTWEGVEEIIKVDVGNKVVAPVTTIKVVKETRTTDSEYDVTNDVLGFEEAANCWTGTTVSKDENGDNYSDVQIYVNKEGNGFAPGYYFTVEEAVKDFLADTHSVLAPGAQESKEDQYYAKYANKSFANYEEAYAWLEEQGLVKSVYDEDGDLTKIYVNETAITDYKGRELANARYEITVPTYRRADEDTKKALVDALVSDSQTNLYNVFQLAQQIAEPTALPNYTAKTELKWGAYLNGDDTNPANYVEIVKGDIVIVDEYKGELNVVAVVKAAHINDSTKNPYVAGWSLNNANLDPIPAKNTEGKVTVYSVEKGYDVVKIATVSPVEVKAYTPYSTMLWDEEAGSFVKTENKFSADYFDNGTDLVNAAGTAIEGFWWGNEHVADQGDAEPFYRSNLVVGHGTLGLEKIVAASTIENETDKWLLTKNVVITGVNTKKEQVTALYGNGKEVVLPAVELENGQWVPAFDSEETLVKVATKLLEGKVGVKFNEAAKYETKDTTSSNYYNADFATWYTATETLANNYWSGYTHEEDLPENELNGVGSEACSYVVSVESETVDAKVVASEVDTTEAGVKTLTLSAIVDDEVVATKDVKVVVAPRYERQYVNGKVAVLKSFYLDGTLYSEYHYDWAAKTYTATFYAQDGVTVASTANGTL